ncbi:MAG: lipid-A-disaccharide synthase [Rickettsiales bacterium]|nr:lipid-A-disaccharide synthase [Rickettsiales bacterium]
MSKLDHIYIIAGEASGDFLGAKLYRALCKITGKKPKLSGIGGEHLISCNMTSLFPMHELSLMGFVEILPKAINLKLRIRKTVKDILRKQPDVLLTIDSPGFTFRVVKALRKANFDKPIIHYVAPTVWAYKPKRADKTAALFDMLLTLLPFEPKYFEDKPMITHFVGHQVAWEWCNKGSKNQFRERHFIPDDRILLGMLPGSRVNEIKRMMPIYEETIDLLKTKYPNIELIIILRPAMADRVRKITEKWAVPVHLVVGDNEKKDAFAACDAMVAKSGTVALETALAGIPMVTVYKANALTAWMVKRMINIPYVHLINIIAEKEIIPELLQEKCKPALIAEQVTHLLNDADIRDQQILECREVAKSLGQYDEDSPSEKAAQCILDYVAKPSQHPSSASSHHTQTDTEAPEAPLPAQNAS